MDILQSISCSQRTLGILVDPEKLNEVGFPAFAKAMSQNAPQLSDKLHLDQIIFLVGGSTLKDIDLDLWMENFQKTTNLKTVLFPGSAQQLTEHADGLLFLNLISGRNPEYLIGQQVAAASLLKNSRLEIIPTAYLLIDGGAQTAVERVSQTTPMNPSDLDLIADTVLAGKLMGNKLIYLEAGSGARYPVPIVVVRRISELLDIPVIVGGGLHNLKAIKKRFEAGAKMVVIGTAIEQNFNWMG